MSERESSTHSLDDKEDFDRDGVEEEDEYDEGEGENEEEYEEKGENKEYEGEGDVSKDEGDGRAFKEGSLGSSGDGHTCPFILPIPICLLESLKSATLGRSQTSACMTPCSR